MGLRRTVGSATGGHSYASVPSRSASGTPQRANALLRSMISTMWSVATGTTPWGRQRSERGNWPVGANAILPPGFSTGPLSCWGCGRLGECSRRSSGGDGRRTFTALTRTGFSTCHSGSYVANLSLTGRSAPAGLTWFCSRAPSCCRRLRVPFRRSSRSSPAHCGSPRARGASAEHRHECRTPWTVKASDITFLLRPEDRVSTIRNRRVGGTRHTCRYASPRRRVGSDS
jgi:hypothetical protein